MTFAVFVAEVRKRFEPRFPGYWTVGVKYTNNIDEAALGFTIYHEAAGLSHVCAGAPTPEEALTALDAAIQRVLGQPQGLDSVGEMLVRP